MTKDITPADSVCPIYLEPANLEQVAADSAAIAAAKAAKTAARQAVLDKLGLTQDEAQALLG